MKVRCKLNRSRRGVGGSWSFGQTSSYTAPVTDSSNVDSSKQTTLLTEIPIRKDFLPCLSDIFYYRANLITYLVVVSMSKAERRIKAALCFRHFDNKGDMSVLPDQLEHRRC